MSQRHKARAMVAKHMPMAGIPPMPAGLPPMPSDASAAPPGMGAPPMMPPQGLGAAAPSPGGFMRGGMVGKK